MAAASHSNLEEQGTIRVDCDFRGNRYESNLIDAEQPFAALHTILAPSTRHEGIFRDNCV